MVYRNHTMDEDEFEYYLFEKNLQGDIVAVYDEYGFAAVTYTYDAWGNVTETLYDTTSNGQYNSFRYRGYFYDEETGLYYLNSRYYDPATGRFLNADIYVSTGQGLGGYNMYAYCLNEPVFRKDSLGTEAVSADYKDNNESPVDDLGETTKYGSSGGSQGKSLGKAFKWANPKGIRYTHNSISKSFRGGKGLVEDLIKDLKNGSVSTKSIPPINVFLKDGKMYSLDNRRLYAFKQAGMPKIKVIIVDPNSEEIKKEIKKNSPLKMMGFL